MRPWRLNHESYEQYCSEVWGMTPRRLQQIAAGESLKALLAAEEPTLAPTLAMMPEGQTRALASVPEAKRADVLKAALAQPGKMTAAKIKKAKARVIDPAPVSDPVLDDEPEQLPPAAKSGLVCPHCGKEIQ